MGASDIRRKWVAGPGMGKRKMGKWSNILTCLCGRVVRKPVMKYEPQHARCLC